jgi:hypothetical protein
LVSVDENNGIVALEDQLERLEVFVQNLYLDPAVLVEDCGFVEVGRVDFHEHLLFVLRLFPEDF